MYARQAEESGLRINADQRPRIGNVRTARGATDARVRHYTRARYSAIWRFSFVLIGASILLLGYVMMTSNLTGLTYAVARAESQRADLQQKTGRLDDRIAALESPDRLAAIAAQLGMRDPQQFALVRLPVQAPTDTRLAVLTTFKNFFAR